ncbi:hypothetical protein SLS59_009730 [Nothophoma quercina]|uniref:Uncharacterized protein n=1 Tax=Nothophoma quercina TaxID=749835 RepID=A0ABR3QKY9_9PLEO
MTEASIINQRFSKDLNEAIRLFDIGQTDECLALGMDILEDSACPRYHRMKTLVLLGSVIADWNDANQCRVDAEALWQTTRNYYPEGFDKATDEHMHEVREKLDGLIEVLDKEEREGLDAEEIEEAVAILEEQQAVQDAENREEAEHFNMMEDAEGEGAGQVPIIAVDTPAEPSTDDRMVIDDAPV